MSDETQKVEVVKQPEKKGSGKRLREWFGGKIAGQDATQRMKDTWNRIHVVGGFLPVFVEGRLELRLQKMKRVLDEIETDMGTAKTPEALRDVIHESNIKVFMLFHIAGSQWLRGLKTPRLAQKVGAYLEFYQRTIDRPAWSWDLHLASMTMLNISFLPEDVGSVPPYLIESKTVIQPTQETRIKMEDAQST